MSRTLFDHFSILAPIYDRLFPPGALQKLLEVLALTSQHRVLDVGGGTGRVAERMRAYAGQVVIADVSLGMLREASGKERLLLVNSSAEELPFKAESFDRVVIVDALHHVNNQEHTAQEMWRVLKPGGVIVIEEPDIRTLMVKLLALGEKILLMRSHFLTPERIGRLFAYPSSQKKVHAENNSSWITVKRSQ